MIRITRFVARDRLFDVLNLPFVSKIELHSRDNRTLVNPAICKMHIYLSMENETSPSYNKCMTEIGNWARSERNHEVLVMTVTAKLDGFFQEKRLSLFPKYFAEEYRRLCTYYSEEFFNLFNHHKMLDIFQVLKFGIKLKDFKMLNEDLLDPETIRVAKYQQHIEKLERQIADFKKYDEKRKNYYKECLIKLGELESYVQELEEKEGIKKLKELNKEYKRQLCILNKRIFLDKISALTDSEVEVLFTNLELREKLKAEQKVSENLREINSKLIIELNKR